jgi:hypothetical protein
MSSSSKNASGYNLKLYRHVTQYSTANSQRFVFLHELGHVAMLNAYPASYNFTGLDYGADNLHYIDEILPNANTAWVEGWANAFAAWKNGGRVFNLDLGSTATLAFLKANTFEEMTRNELFTGKALYDIMRTLPSGRDKVYDVIARPGPITPSAISAGPTCRSTRKTRWLWPISSTRTASGRCRSTRCSTI